MTEVERLLANYGCWMSCYNNNDCNNCWFRQYIQYELDRKRSLRPICEIKTKINVIL